MVAFDEMYHRLLQASVDGNLEREVADLQALRFDPEQLDCCSASSMRRVLKIAPILI